MAPTCAELARKAQAAAGMARRLYPGAVGEYLADELEDYAKLGLTYGGGRMTRLVAEVHAQARKRAVR